MPKTETIDGVTFQCTHSGQRKAYGDSFTDYEVASDLPVEDVERFCRERIHKCPLSKAQWQAEYKAKPTADNHFRSHYLFRTVAPGRYAYSICFPYAD